MPALFAVVMTADPAQPPSTEPADADAGGESVAAAAGDAVLTPAAVARLGDVPADRAAGPGLPSWLWGGLLILGVLALLLALLRA